jgi:hypothetical protein
MSKIVVSKGHDVLYFYLQEKEGLYFLFSQKFSKGVWKFFENGRYEAELLAFHDWKRNPRLNKTIERIPRVTRYVRRYVLAA